MISSGDEGGLTFVGLVSSGSTGDGSGRLTGSTGAVDFFITSTAGCPLSLLLLLLANSGGVCGGVGGILLLLLLLPATFDDVEEDLDKGSVGGGGAGPFSFLAATWKGRGLN